MSSWKDLESLNMLAFGNLKWIHFFLSIPYQCLYLICLLFHKCVLVLTKLEPTNQTMCHCIILCNKWTLFHFKGFELEITPNSYKSKCLSSCQPSPNLNFPSAFLIMMQKNLCLTKSCFFPLLKKDKFSHMAKMKDSIFISHLNNAT